MSYLLSIRLLWISEHNLKKDSTYLNHGIKRGGKILPELLPNVKQISLTPGHDDSDEGMIIGPSSL